MKILVVDDQRAARRVILQILATLPEVDVAEAKSFAEAAGSVDASPPDLVLLDIRLSTNPGDRGGLDLLRRLGQTHPGVPVVMVTASSEVDEIRQAMRLGAKDYVFKDELSPEMLLPIVVGLREKMMLEGEVVRLRERVDGALGLSAIVGSSPAMDQVRQLVQRLAASDATILIRGETGVGKEMVARALHELSPRRDEPFVAINCSALPATLMESLIFGHERGVFTGADKRKRGQFEIAGGGTVLLDEVAEMPVGLQAKLLRVLEDRRFRPLGASDELPLRARVLASTHANLEKLLAEGTMRADLFYRLNVVSLSVPSLLERKEDIPELVHAFVADSPRKVHFSDKAMEWLVERPWPGNVRELKNIVLRVTLLAEENNVDDVTLAKIAGDSAPGELDLEKFAEHVLAMPAKLGNKLEIVERSLISKALAMANGKKANAARLIGIERKAFERRYERFGEPGKQEEAEED